MLVGKDGMPIEGLAVMAGKEAPVRVAPGRACMRCAYIKVLFFEFHMIVEGSSCFNDYKI